MRVVILVLLAVPAIFAQQDCSQWTDESQCFNEETCPSGYLWEEGIGVCGNCGACKEYLNVCDVCVDDKTEPICLPGYTCKNVKSVNRCMPVAKTCDAVKLQPCIHWDPVCVRGEYAPRQCKGVKANGRCFCMNTQGVRIFGEQEWRNAENMTCACSRRADDLKNIRNRKDVTLHCTEDGNYDKLQCDDGLCWCADEKTGVAMSRILPETMMTMLYCYNETEIGSQYLRICESKLIAQYKLEIEMGYHGTINPNFPLLNCDRDGSYGAVQLNMNLLQCWWKDSSPLGSYASEVTGLAKMNCKCARDKKRNPDIQLQCDGNGNYKLDQLTGEGVKYKVDDDGFTTDSTCKGTFACPAITTTATTTVSTSTSTSTTVTAAPNPGAAVA